MRGFIRKINRSLPGRIRLITSVKKKEIWSSQEVLRNANAFALRTAPTSLILSPGNIAGGAIMGPLISCKTCSVDPGASRKVYTTTSLLFEGKSTPGGLPQLSGPPRHCFFTQHSVYRMRSTPHSGGGCSGLSFFAYSAKRASTFVLVQSYTALSQPPNFAADTSPALSQGQ